MANPVCEVLLTESALPFPAREPAPLSGGVVDFQGIVRLLEEGREIEGIDYEAHGAMARHQLEAIGNQAIDQFRLDLVIIHHRLGFVPAGKTSLLLRVASRHRQEAFQAAQWIVDELKKKVPIWKHPRFKDGVRPAAEAGRKDKEPVPQK